MIHFKPCTIDDIEQLSAISIKTYSEHYPYIWHDAGIGYMAYCFNINTLTKEIEEKNTQFYFIEFYQEVVGVLKLNLAREIQHYQPNEALEIQRLYLLEKTIGHGIGKAAIAFAISVAQQLNKKIIWLRAMKNSKALVFYQKQGFVVIDEAIFQFPKIKEEEQGIVTLVKPI